MRVGLVLGAGGVVGASWLIGALEALESETGFHPADAELIVGTSAGSVIAALTAIGLEPALLSAHSTGESLDAFEGLEARFGDIDLDEVARDREDVERYRLQRALPPIGPGSLRMALGTLLHPRRHSAAAMLTGWFPRGFVSTAPISALVDRFLAPEATWPEHPGLRIVGCDYATGGRTVFGDPGAPPADIRDAVAASCAIPGFYHPVTIAGRRYVDGGVCSASNLDVAVGHDLDVVIGLNPTSSLAELSLRSPTSLLAGAVRAASGRRLGHEAHKLAADGAEVLLVQPSSTDLGVMGTNLMARDRRVEVMEEARRSTALYLRERRSVLPKLTGRSTRRRATRAVPAGKRAAA